MLSPTGLLKVAYARRAHWVCSAARLLAVVCLCTLTEITTAQSRRQELIAAVKDSCHSSETHLIETQLPALRRKSIAFRILATDWKEKMPLHLRENMPVQVQYGLKIELATLRLLSDSTEALEHLIKACEAITEDADRDTIARLAEAAKQLDDSLKQLGDRWKRQPQKRANFKDSLNKSIDLMMRYNPMSIGTYISMKVEVDPDSLDLAITYQRTILTPAQTGFSLLK